LYLERTDWFAACSSVPMVTADIDLTDDILAARAQRGSSPAFVELVRRHRTGVLRLGLRLCPNRSDAEEVCQEVFRLAYKWIGSFRGDARFGTWLRSIATNEALMRRRAVRRSTFQSLELCTSTGLSADAPGADELLHQKRLTEDVLNALASLDDAHRSAIVLRDLQELPADEAAAVLGVSPQALRQRTHRARVKLRKHLGDRAW
jgi:RNA polymerase sigma-70 factor (ECF subfamily)